MMLRYAVIASSLISVAAAGSLCQTYQYSTQGYICNNFQRRCLSKGTPKDKCAAKHKECINYKYSCFVKQLYHPIPNYFPGAWTMCCDGPEADRSREFVTGYEGLCSYQVIETKEKRTPIYHCKVGDNNFDLSTRLRN